MRIKFITKFNQKIQNVKKISLWIEIKQKYVDRFYKQRIIQIAAVQFIILNRTKMSNIINPLFEKEQMKEILQQPRSNARLEEIQETNPIVLLKQPQLFKETFNKIIKNAQSSFKNKDLENGLLFYNKAADMLDLGKNILKENISKYTKLTIFVNLAYGYQNLRKLQKANRFCQRAKEELDKLIALSKNQEYSIEKYLQLAKFLVTLKFQHCAIVSQLQLHEKALEMCKSTLPQLTQQLLIMIKYIRQTSSSKITQKKAGQTVQFSKHVHKFAQTLLVELLNFLNEPLKKFHFYHWEKNPELNEQQVKRKFIPSSIEAKNECKRSILGVTKQTSWMDEFNIGSIMHMSMVSIDDFETTLPMQEYFFKDRLYELVILCSLSYFTMATEIRFLQPLKQKQQGQDKQLPPPQFSGNNPESQIKSNVTQGQQQFHHNSNTPHTHQPTVPDAKSSPLLSLILKKYGYEQRSQMHKLSELYHLRSIEIVSKHIQTTIPYLVHIIKSYDKHYLKRKELEPITAISEEQDITGVNQSMKEYLPEMENEENDILQEQLKLQSHYEKLVTLSHTQADKKSCIIKNTHDNQHDVKSILYYHPQNRSLPTQNEELTTLNAKRSYFRKDFSKTIENPRLQTQNNLKKLVQDQQTGTPQQNQFTTGEYLKSKKQIQTVKSCGKQKNQDKKRTKSKSKLNLIKSRQKSKSSALKKNQKSSQKNIYTYRSPKEEKKHDNKLIYQAGKQETIKKDSLLQTKKYHSPELITVNETKKRQKTHLNDKSRSKIIKKFTCVPNSHCEENNKHQEPKAAKKSKQNEKATQQQEGKKKQAKYFTAFDGEKQYRIKHQSTTHIKVFCKKKGPQQGIRD